jgi:hypothetical protein
MKLIITDYISQATEVVKTVTVINIAPFDSAAGAVLLSSFQAKGDIISASAAETIATLHAGADGEVLTLDSTAAGGLKWAAGSGSTVQEFTNKDAASLAAGDVVILNSDYDIAVSKTNIASDLRVVGVAAQTVAADDLGNINTLAGVKCLVNCDTGAISRGQFLVSSATSGQAKSGGYFNTPATFAIALTEKAAGSAGQVTCLLIPNIPFVIKGTTAWAAGGDNASSELTNTQQFVMAAAAWSTIAGAALTVGRGTSPLGIGDTNISGIVIGGMVSATSNNLAYKLTYASPTFAADSGMNMASGMSYLHSGANSPLKGYRATGYTGAWVLTCDKFIFAGDTRSALSSYVGVANYHITVSDGVTIYSIRTTGYKITVSSDTVAANTGSNNAISLRAPSMSFPGTAGYGVDSTTCYKLDFSSGNYSTLGSSPASAHDAGGCVTDGLNYGWACGKAATPYSASDKFTKSAETWAVDGTAVLNPGKSGAALFNNGAY